ncbi:MAG TPA: hypothetical protein VK172_15700 [Lentimicrobium sp.]|nr:hypothetical protein [Lentimicrobium sp.]
MKRNGKKDKVNFPYIEIVLRSMLGIYIAKIDALAEHRHKALYN